MNPFHIIICKIFSKIFMKMIEKYCQTYKSKHKMFCLNSMVSIM